tara:strand:+ start:5885 stop:6229 length:345 start_codon:yes stop_codon:yes gene_type:complete
MEILYFILCSYGLTQILVYSKIFEKIRPRHYFFHCPMCVGFWVGALLVLLNPFTELFTFDVSVVNLFLMGWLSSGTSYALCMLISDGGLQYEYRAKGHVDTEVETKTGRQVLQG